MTTARYVVCGLLALLMLCGGVLVWAAGGREIDDNPSSLISFTDEGVVTIEGRQGRSTGFLEGVGPIAPDESSRVGRFLADHLDKEAAVAGGASVRDAKRLAVVYYDKVTGDVRSLNDDLAALLVP